MKKRLISCLLALTFLVSLTACGTSGNSASKTPSNGAEVSGAPTGDITLTVAAGGVSGTWYSVMAGLSEIVNKQEKGLVMKVVPGGSITNPVAIQNGEVDAGLTTAAFAMAARDGTEPYEAENADVMGLFANLNPNCFEITAIEGCGYSSLEEAITSDKPARIMTAPKSTSTGWHFDRILEFYGVTVEEIEKKGGSVTYTDYGDWSQMATDGHVDVMFNQGGIPSSTLMEITTNVDVVELPWPEALANYFKETYALVDWNIKAGTYEWLEEDVPALQAPTVMTVNANFSEEAVYTLLEIMDENIEQVRALHPSLANFDMSTSWSGTGVDLHPGAAKFFTEKGYMK